MAGTTTYQVGIVFMVKKPRDEISTVVRMTIDVAAMNIEQAIPEARLYLDALKIQNSTGWVSGLEFESVNEI